LRSIWAGKDEALAELHLPDRFHADLTEHLLHPALLDVAASFYTYDKGGGYYVPTFFEEIVVHEAIPSHVYVHARERADGQPAGALRLDIEIMDRDGRVLVAISGFSFSIVSMTDGAAGHPSAISEVDRDEVAAGLSEQEAVECLVRLMRDPLPPQVIVTPVNLPAASSSSRTSVTASPELHPRPDLPVPYVAPRTETERSIARVFMKLLGLQRIGLNDDFLDLGADSTIFMEAVILLYEAEGLVITPEQFFEYPTVARLAQSPMARKPQPETAEAGAAAGADAATSRTRPDLDPHPEELVHLRRLFGD
jgi:acyl carrier protein